MVAGDADDRWTPRATGPALLGIKSGATRLGLAALLKRFAGEGCFPRRGEDVSLAAVEAIPAQMGVPAAGSGVRLARPRDALPPRPDSCRVRLPRGHGGGRGGAGPPVDRPSARRGTPAQPAAGRDAGAVPCVEL